MRLHKAIIIVFALCFNAIAGFRFSNSDFNSTSGTVIKYDKVEHLVGSMLLFKTIDSFTDNRTAVQYSILCGIAWEIKDGFMPYEKYGWFGGDGFCFRDLAADVFGVLLASRISGERWTVNIRPIIQ